MSHHRNSPPRTRPDLGRPAGPRSRRDHRPRATEEEQEAVVEGVTGLRPEIPAVEEPYVPAGRPTWVVALAVGGAAALAGWVTLAALASVAWLSAPVGTYPEVLEVATQLWLAGHGGGFVADGSRWTLVPYGLSVGLGLLLAQLGSTMVRRLGADSREPAGSTRADLVRSALVVVAYGAAVGLVGLVAGGPGQGARSLVGALLLASAADWWSRWRTQGPVVAVRFPPLVGAAARAVGVGTALLAAVGAAALVTGLVVQRGRLVMLVEGLGGGFLGGLGSFLVQVAYLPSFIVWAISYVLGAGFGLGDGSLVSPADTHVGLLPGWPVTAALPAPGPGGPADLAWLSSGVVAGGLAAAVFLRRAAWRRPDTTMLAGGLAGLLVGLSVTLLGLLARGDLGVARLAGLGPRPLELLVLAGVLTTAGGLVVGLVVGIARWRRLGRSAPPATTEAGQGSGDPGPRTDSTGEAGPA